MIYLILTGTIFLFLPDYPKANCLTARATVEKCQFFVSSTINILIWKQNINFA